MFERNKGFYSEEEQIKLKNSTVLQIGVGGIGCVTAELLVRSGVGTLILVDGDSFEVTNLNRQIGATQNTLGQNKAVAMSERLKSINPDVNIITVTQFLDKKWGKIIPTTNINVKEKIDIIIDATDGIVNKILVSDYARENGKKLVSGRIYKYSYWVAVLDDTKSVNDFTKNRLGLTPIVNQCTLFECSARMALFVCNSLIERLKDINFVLRYNNKTKTLNKERLR
jgi:molybdopterin/thiamine biosynthesis adenylyltransferase